MSNKHKPRKRKKPIRKCFKKPEEEYKESKEESEEISINKSA